MPSNWLIIERLANWEADSSNNFSFFGLPKRYSRLFSEIAVGDTVFCYVSRGRSSFADIRIVRQTNIKMPRNETYDTAFHYFTGTTPLLILDRRSWVPIKSLDTKLELTAGRSDYRPLLQTSIRRLSDHDSATIKAAMQAVASEDNRIEL